MWVKKSSNIWPLENPYHKDLINKYIILSNKLKINQGVYYVDKTNKIKNGTPIWWYVVGELCGCYEQENNKKPLKISLINHT